MSGRKNASAQRPGAVPAAPPHRAAAAALLASAPRPDLGRMVAWSPPAEMRRLDVYERLGPEVPAVIARVHEDGAVDLHPFPPLGSPSFRVEFTWKVARDDDGAQGTWRFLED